VARYTALRASDADRDAVAERLRHAAVEGRLDADELEQRLHTAFRARTYGELDRLLADLPARPLRVERPRGAARTAFVVGLRVAAVLAALTAVVAFAAVAFVWVVMWLVIWFAISSSRHHRCGHVRRMSPRRL
jgi:fatty acid desaturase